MRYLLALYLVLVQSFTLFADSIKIYNLTLSQKKSRSTEKMIVHESKNGYKVEFYDSSGESSINEFSLIPASLKTEYRDSSLVPYMKIIFNQSAREIKCSGRIDKTYPWEPNVFDGNGSLFFIFSKILPQPDQEITFNLLQSKEKRVVKMFLRFIYKEVIQVGNKKVEAEVYETGLVNRFLVFFWPYRYRYWYSTDTHEFLRYQGPIGHENAEIIEVND